MALLETTRKPINDITLEKKNGARALTQKKNGVRDLFQQLRVKHTNS